MNTAAMHALACEYAKTHDENVLSQAVEAALPLCRAIAYKFQNRGIDPEDLYQVASLALVQALQGFDPARGLQFSTYVTPTVAGKVRNYLRDRAEIVRTPRTLRDQATQLYKAQQDFLSRARREPTAQELSEMLSWPLSRVLETLQSRQNAQSASLDDVDADGMGLSDLLGGEEAGFAQFETREDLAAAMALLSPIEKNLLHLRYFSRLTQRDTAEKLGISQMQVSRIERRALALLKERLGGR